MALVRDQTCVGLLGAGRAHAACSHGAAGGEPVEHDYVGRIAEVSHTCQARCISQRCTGVAKRLQMAVLFLNGEEAHGARCWAGELLHVAVDEVWSSRSTNGGGMDEFNELWQKTGEKRGGGGLPKMASSGSRAKCWQDGTTSEDRH
jgi:hypothetical protein